MPASGSSRWRASSPSTWATPATTIPALPADLFFDFNEFSLVVGYDFGVAQVSGAVRYSPNFFANSGIAWYKWGQVTVPLTFINFNENVTFKVFGTVGNQYVERFTNYGIGYNNYWDWQIGIGATVYGFDLSVAYVDTNLDVAELRQHHELRRPRHLHHQQDLLNTHS